MDKYENRTEKAAYIFSHYVIGGLMYVVGFLFKIMNMVILKLKVYRLFKPTLWFKTAPIGLAVTLSALWLIDNFPLLLKTEEWAYLLAPLIMMVIMLSGFVMVGLSTTQESFTNKRLLGLILGFGLSFLGNIAHSFMSATLIFYLFFTYFFVNLLISKTDVSILQKIPVLKEINTFCTQLISEWYAAEENPDAKKLFNPSFFIIRSIVIMVSTFLFFSIFVISSELSKGYLYFLRNSLFALGMLLFISTFLMVAYPITAGLLIRYNVFRYIFSKISPENIALLFANTRKGIFVDLANTEFRYHSYLEPYTYTTRNYHTIYHAGSTVHVAVDTAHTSVRQRERLDIVRHSNFSTFYSILLFISIYLFIFLNLIILIFSPFIFPVVFVVQFLTWLLGKHTRAT